MSKIKIPSYDDAQKSLDIRRRSKTGRQVSREEHRFNEKIMRKYYKWAIATEAQIFNETVPFGSAAHCEVIKFTYQDTESKFTLPDKPESKDSK